jgi:hypothetical protein
MQEHLFFYLLPIMRFYKPLITDIKHLLKKNNFFF